ncbi:MAG: hypothetical protein QM655_14530 [Nocardioidaceae bacterium]
MVRAREDARGDLMRARHRVSKLLLRHGIVYYDGNPSLLTIEQIEEAIGSLDLYAHECHAASIALVKSGLLGESRVARGTCAGVGG